MPAPAIRQSRKPSSKSDVAAGAAAISPPSLGAPGPLIALVLDNEDTAAYEEILARISAAVKPTDFLEDIWVRDVAALVWEAFRLRRLKTCLMEAAAPQGLARVLSPLLSRTVADGLADGWAKRDRECVRQVESLLKQADLTMEHVTAATLAERIEDFERIDRMIASAEQRRSAMLREVDRHRASLASRLRLASEEAVEAEFEDVVPDLAGPGGRAQ